MDPACDQPTINALSPSYCLSKRNFERQTGNQADITK
jgi:hypothetical protein